MQRVKEWGIEVGAVPVDTVSAAVDSDWVSLKGYSHVTAVILQGAWAGGTPAVTLKQATVVAGTDTKALAFTKKWVKTGLASNTFTEGTVTANTFNLVATANQITVLEIDAASLDVDNDFDCMQVAIASPGANADLIAVFYILSGARYPQETMEAATAD